MYPTSPSSSSSSSSTSPDPPGIPLRSPLRIAARPIVLTDPLLAIDTPPDDEQSSTLDPLLKCGPLSSSIFIESCFEANDALKTRTSSMTIAPFTPPPSDSDTSVDADPATFFTQDCTSIFKDAFPNKEPLSNPQPVCPASPASVEEEGMWLSSPPPLTLVPTISKRYHALHELLSSERAYASDLALIRDIHIPLALGERVRDLPFSPPVSSASSSLRTSSSSDTSIPAFGPPMTSEDVKTIFSNIASIAFFADHFSDELEGALGSVLEGGEGDDRVGALFLKIIPELERPYKYYITRHPTSLQHLQALPQSPALTAYLVHAQHVASSLTHAWDLASLLIKPVQRLLKYPLLLGAIIDETPESHTDKENLRLARTRLEEVARNVNEGRRRAEVVKDVLASKKKLVNVGVAASVNLSKMKSLRHGGRVFQLADNSEAAEVERMHAELKRVDVFAQQFAKNVVDWTRMMSNMMRILHSWALSFGRVIGLTPDQGSEAFEAFLGVVELQLMPLCVDLESVITERLLKEIAHLLTTMNKPLKLLASMNEQEPFHYYLLTMPVTPKNRPPAALLEASTNYLALRGQLASELPQYLNLLHAGLATIVRTLAVIQTELWRDVRDRWGDLWEMLRVEGELNAGHRETVAVWRTRWGDVDEVMCSLNINQVRRLYQDPVTTPPRNSSVAAVATPAFEYASPRYRASDSQQQYVSPPYALVPSRSLARGASDASTRHTSRRNSSDSIHSGKSQKARYVEEEVVPPLPQALPRTKSMPLGPDKTSFRTANSSRTMIHEGETGFRHSEWYDQVQLEREREGERERERVGQKDRDKARDREREREKENQKEREKEIEREREKERDKERVHPSQVRRKSVDPPKKPSQARHRSGSVKSITAFFSSQPNNSTAPATPGHQHDMNAICENVVVETRAISPAQRDSWVNKEAKYVCQVIHPCKPPEAVAYFSFPFFTLVEGELYEILQEAGHPSIHSKLPLYVDDGEDCLLLCRNPYGNIGWALASFLHPVGQDM